MALYPLAQVEEQPTGMGGRGMTYKEAKRILHPYTTRKALAEIEFFGGFHGKEKSRKAVDEACLIACEALDKQIPEPPVVLVTTARLIALLLIGCRFPNR